MGQRESTAVWGHGRNVDVEMNREMNVDMDMNSVLLQGRLVAHTHTHTERETN